MINIVFFLQILFSILLCKNLGKYCCEIKHSECTSMDDIHIEALDLLYEIATLVSSLVF